MILLLLLSGALAGKLLVLVGTLIIGAVFYVSRQEKNQSGMQSLADSLGLDLVKIAGGAFDNEGIKLTGIINDYEVKVVNNPRYKLPHELVISVRLKNDGIPGFKLTRNEGLRGFVESKIGNDLQIGHEEFDNYFNLESPDIHFAQRLFDIKLCNDFAANHETFNDTIVFCSHGYIEFREPGEVNKQNQIERLREIVDFLVHVAERTDSCRNSKLYR